MNTHADALARAESARAGLAATVKSRWYPAFHAAAPAGWINDPNGLSYVHGRYHLFYQHHPYSTVWGPMHWGHLSSPDLIHWRHEPIALAPGDDEDEHGVWSGSAVEAPDGRMLLFYTGHRWRDGVGEEGGMSQVQCMATSEDATTFTKKGVIVQGPDLEHFRDPKVWWQDGTWYMVFGASSPQGRGQVWMYTSPDLEEWTFDRVVFEDPDPDVFMVECPDMFELDGHWVITYGPMTRARREGYGGRNGHNAGYVVGRWRPGEDFVQTRAYRHADWGHNFYAAQSLLTPDHRRVTIGWLGGFILPMAPQAEDGWAGQMSIPRELHLDEDLNLVSTPIEEFEALRLSTLDFGSFTLGADEERVLLDDADIVEVLLSIDLSSSGAEQVNLLVHSTAPGCATRVGWDDLMARVVVDRGLHRPTDRGMRAAPFDGKGCLDLRVVVDRGSVEVFIGDGEAVLSSLSYPGEGRRALRLSNVSGPAVIKSCVVHRLAPAW